MEIQQRRVDEEIEEIEKVKGGKVGKVWEIKKKVIGGKKATIEATTIINPKTGKLALSRSEIKKVSLDYAKETLKNNEVEECVADKIERKKEEARKLMEENAVMKENLRITL